MSPDIDNPIMAADCCYFCKHRGVLYGVASDAVICSVRERTVRHVEICNMFKKRGTKE